MNPNQQPTKTKYSLEEVMQMYGSNQPVRPPAVPVAKKQATEQAVNNNGFAPWVDVDFDFGGSPSDFVDAQGNLVPQSVAKNTALGAAEGAAEGLVNSVGNLIPSAANFVTGIGTGIAKAVLHPIDTAKSIGSVIKGAGGLVKQSFGNSPIGAITPTPSAEDTQAANQFGQLLKDRYGGLRNLSETAQNDPFAFGAELTGVAGTAASLAGKGAQFANTTSRLGQTVTQPVGKTLSTVSNKIGNTTRFGISQATGLSPETIKTITGNVDDFAKAQATGRDRTDLADNVISAVNKAGDEISDLGQAYNPIRQSGAQVSLPENWLQTNLSKYGLKFSDEGKVIADRASRTRNTTDINKIQEFIDNWGDARTLTADEYLNMRHDLAELAKYDQTGKSTVVRDMARNIREGVLNADDVRNQIPGLKELDARFAEDIKFYNKIKKDFLNADGSIKDGAASKIVNSINAANPERLARLERLYPGFTKQAQVIKALEDVENAMGLKVGTYTRGALIGGQAIMGNVPGAVVTAILTQPEIAVPLLKGYGYTAKNIEPVLRAVREAATDINNFRVPGAAAAYVEQKFASGAQLGMFIRPLHIDDINTFHKYASTKNPSPRQTQIVKDTLKSYGMKVPPTQKQLKDFIEQVLEGSHNKQMDKQINKSFR